VHHYDAKKLAIYRRISLFASPTPNKKRRVGSAMADAAGVMESAMARIDQEGMEELTILNGHGCMTIMQWARLRNSGYSTAARRARRLNDDGLLRRLKLPPLAVSPLVLTQKGCDLIGDTLAPVTHLRVAEFDHDSTVVDMAFDLVSRFGGTWITERRWHQVHPNASHTPDGVLRLSDGDIAVEVELTAKSPKRLSDILADHAANLAFRQVWYLTDSDPVATLVRRLAKGYPQIKVVRFKRRRIDHA
jgi:hypothetical protein